MLSGPSRWLSNSGGRPMRLEEPSPWRRRLRSGVDSATRNRAMSGVDRLCGNPGTRWLLSAGPITSASAACTCPRQSTPLDWPSTHPPSGGPRRFALPKCISSGEHDRKDQRAREVRVATARLLLESPVLAALACSRMSPVSLTDVHRLRRRDRALVPAVRRPTGRTTLRAVSCSPKLEAVVTTDAGGARRLGRLTKTEGRQEDSPEKGESLGRPFAVLGAKRLAVKAPGEPGGATSATRVAEDAGFSGRPA